MWSDDKAELLLKFVMTIKLRKLPKIDWESVKSKYSDIYELFKQALPDEDSDVLRSFPHKKEEITNEVSSSSGFWEKEWPWAGGYDFLRIM